MSQKQYPFAASTMADKGPPRLHVHPHGAHLDTPEKLNAAIDDEEHDYEALPMGYGWGVNMAAGAMVSGGGVFRNGSLPY